MVCKDLLVQRTQSADRRPRPGNGIINADGELWRIQRKAGLRFFSNANLKTFIDHALPPILDDTERFLDQALSRRDVVDMQHVFLDLTTRLMGKMAYDVRQMLQPHLRYT